MDGCTWQAAETWLQRAAKAQPVGGWDMSGGAPAMAWSGNPLLAALTVEASKPAV
jgi:hypothetical protein